MSAAKDKLMFTGLVNAVGEIVAVEDRPGLRRLTVDSPYDPASIALGASISHDGACLTVVEIAAHGAGARHVVELAAETLAVTNLSRLQPGARVNLERSLKLGDELGGHLVSGHVDGLGDVVSVAMEGEGWRVHVRAPNAIAGLIAPKGSIAVDGVSLTVNGVQGSVFDVLIIPHTWGVTTLARLRPGDQVNLEADMLARYVARLMAHAAAQKDD
jgi:riboflavin synthase